MRRLKKKFNKKSRKKLNPGARLLRETAWKNVKLERIKSILDAGAPLEIKDRGGHTPLLNAIFSGRGDVVALLTERGADANGGIYPDGTTPLHVATAHLCCTQTHFGGKFESYRDIMKALIAAGANVNAQTDFGETPLMRAVCMEDENKEAVRQLLAAGADITLRDRDGQTALDQARWLTRPLLEDAMAEVAAEKDRRMAMVQKHIDAGMPAMEKISPLPRIWLKTPK